MCTHIKHRQKVKAAKGSNSESTLNSEKHESGPVEPGTSKYTGEWANPSFNPNIDLSLDSNKESLDMDKVSLSSLDHGIDMKLQKKFKKPVMEDGEQDGGPSG
ncbi:cadherin-related family member 2 [Xyrichtys novacula]|uniref:Cadherin-related family member 2 n=1 Tax=Xyrichtys novacula TaxID=13765 RepID=A0AAV1FAT4_XYRNO|nr:cadherin-related family member 2 [Xyrichtys novacula]